MTMTPRTASNGRRLPQLDGLRGVAAMIVVVHHSMLLSPGFAETYALADYPAMWSGVWWLSATPLKLLTAGGEAVTVFFVLSGFVLALPVLRSASFDWMAYYPRRLVRIYIPAAVSVVFAVALLYLVPAAAGTSYGPWVDRFTAPVPEVAEIVAAADLVFGNPYINNPLWSLRWEVLFSLMLPLFVGVALVLSKRPALAVILVSAVTALGLLWRNDSLTYLPAFLAGSILAASLSLWQSRARRVSAARWNHPFWFFGAVLAVVMLIAYWLVRPLADESQPILAATRVLSLLGAVLLVLLAAFWAPAVRILSSRLFQFLGVISFSIYLVHVPIAFAAIRIFGPTHWYLASASTVVVAFGVSILFSRFIEQPSHRLSRTVGRVASERARSMEAVIRRENQSRAS